MKLAFRFDDGGGVHRDLECAEMEEDNDIQMDQNDIKIWKDEKEEDIEEETILTENNHHTKNKIKDWAMENKEIQKDGDDAKDEKEFGKGGPYHFAEIIITNKNDKE